MKPHNNKRSLWPILVLRLFCDPDLLEDLEGDLLELYSQKKRQNKKWVNWRLAYEVLLLFRPGIIRGINIKSFNSNSMIRNYLKIIGRQLVRNRLTTSINLAGLTLGFAAALLISLFILNELSYESFHSKADRIGRVTVHYHDGDYDMQWARVDLDWVKTMPEEFPEVEHYIRFQDYYPRNIKVGNETFRIEHAFSTDKEVFQVFDFELLKGDSETALSKPFTTVLSQATATKLYGQVDPIGKELTIITDSGVKEVYTVTGLIKDVPSNTHLPVNMLTSFQSEEQRVGWAYTYVLLQEGSSTAEFEEKLDPFIKKNMAEEASTVSLPIQSLKSIHLKSDLAREIIPGGNPIYLYLFLAVGLFILTMSVINFLNLNTVQSIKKLREIGVRKALGSSRSGLSGYFFTESFSLVVVSAIMGVILVYFILPSTNDLIRSDASLLQLLPFLIISVVVIGFVSGYYPAFILSRTNVISAIKNKQDKSTHGGISIKNSLVAVQLVLCVVLISAALITRNQFKYLVEKNLGMEKEQVLAITDLPIEAKRSLLSFKNFLSSISDVDGVTSVMQVPSDEIRDAGPVYAEGKIARDDENAPVLDIQVVDNDFINVLGLETVAGRNFSPVSVDVDMNLPVEQLIEKLQSRPREYIINETAMKKIGWESAEEAIGRQFSWQIGGIQLQEGPIIGVIEDYHQESLRNTVEPMVMINEPIWIRHLLVKLNGKNIQSTITRIEKYWKENYSEYPIEYAFLDDLYQKLYDKEQTQLQLIYLFSSLAIFIAFLGIFGLMSYSLKSREKEITIRKVLGATERSIVYLLGRSFFRLTLIGVLIGIPATWFVMNIWLQNFAYRVSINPGYFVLATALIVGVLFLTILVQMQRQRNRSVTDSLRSE